MTLLSSCFTTFTSLLLRFAPPPGQDQFGDVRTWATNVTNIIQLFGFGLAGGAFAVGFILLMVSWGNERRETTAKAALIFAAIGFAGLLAVALIETIVAHIVGQQLPS
ncbi:MAG TPA: hypothetical protein VH593_15005 [Ktedonobacteraceae bacterium]